MSTRADGLGHCVQMNQNTRTAHTLDVRLVLQNGKQCAFQSNRTLAITMKPSVVASSPVAATNKLSWIQNSEDMVGQPSYRETHKLAIHPASEMSMFLTMESPHSAEFEWANIH